MVSHLYTLILNDTTTPAFYTLSLHDALPIFRRRGRQTLHGARTILKKPARASLLRLGLGIGNRRNAAYSNAFFHGADSIRCTDFCFIRHGCNWVLPSPDYRDWLCGRCLRRT